MALDYSLAVTQIPSKNYYNKRLREMIFIELQGQDKNEEPKRPSQTIEKYASTMLNGLQ